MTIWHQRPKPDHINRASTGSLAAHLGIEITDIGDDYLAGRMPVDKRTCQPWGMLHGGSSAALAETLGSVAGTFVVDPEQAYVVGLEINANHIRPVQDGWVQGRATPFHLGRTTQVWQIEISDEDQRLVSVSRLTLAVRPLPPEVASPFLRGREGSSA